MVKFSLLMCVYARESPQYLYQCLDSLRLQTVLPEEFILVKDGPLTEELDAVIDNMSFPFRLNIIALPNNVTQGPARAAGLERARYEWVAIMDSDDICTPDRFEKQVNMIKANPELCLIGGQTAEFADTPENIVAARTVPITHRDICRYAKKRNPFNAMTVMFRRELALRAGSYHYFPWFEDYDLWIRMIKIGAVCANHPDVLIYARVGNGMYGRRRGTTYIKSEFRMQKCLLENRFINKAELVRNVLLRVPVRLLPEKALTLVYNTFARSKST